LEQELLQIEETQSVLDTCERLPDPCQLDTSHPNDGILCNLTYSYTNNREPNVTHHISHPSNDVGICMQNIDRLLHPFEPDEIFVFLSSRIFLNLSALMNPPSLG